MKIINGDIFDSDAVAILHQVNCMGVMGSGVAKQVKRKFPLVYFEYKRLCDEHKDDPAPLMGVVQVCEVDDKKYIVNLFAQKKFGRDGTCYTDYNALRICLNRVNQLFAGRAVALPYMMSCVRGGGDWNVVSNIIATELIDCDVTLYRL